MIYPLPGPRPPFSGQSESRSQLGRRLRCWLSERFFSRPTISSRITAITLTLALPLNLVITAVIWHLSEAASSAQRTGLLYTARSVAAAVDAKLGEHLALVRMLARSPALLDEALGAFDAEARRAFDSPDAWILVSDLEGQQLVNTRQPLGHPLLVRNPIGFAAQKRAFDTGSTIVTPIRVGMSSHRWITTIEVPIFKNGQPFRALSVSVDAQSFIRLLNAQQMPENYLAGITDCQGRYIARVPGDEGNTGQLAESFQSFKDRDGVFEILSLEGDAVVLAQARAATSGWLVGVGVKKAEIQAGAWRTISWSLMLGGGFSLLSLLLASAMARSIAGPLSKLRQKAGKLLVEPPRSTPMQGPPEVRDLWQALIKSAQALRQSDERFRGVFEHAVIGIVIRDMEERFLSCNPAYIRMLGYSEEELRAFAFPTYVHPEDRDENIALCKKVASGEIPSFEIVNRYVRKDGQSIWVHKLVSLLRDPAGQPTNILVLVTDMTERKRFEEALRVSEERSRGIFEYAGTGIAIGDMEGRLQSGNPAYCSMLGYTKEELRGLTIEDLVHPEDAEACLANFRRLVAQEIPSFQSLNRYVAKDGRAVWVHKHVSLLRDDRGRPISALALVTDVTERKRQENHINLLMREVNHRSKNMLSLVQAVARQTLAANPEDFLDRFGKRIEALAANQDLLIKNAWNGADIAELVRSQLAPFDDLTGTRIELRGPPLFVSANAAQALGMALHELATNAGKYGALSSTNGRIEVGWCIQRDERDEEIFVMTWREQCAHLIAVPDRQGFGSFVVGSMAELSLSAKVDLSFPATGVIWQLRCAARAVLEGTISSAAPGETVGPLAVQPPASRRPRILVVEDQPLVAVEIANAITEAGFEVLGPARSVPQALELLKGSGCDAAVLDINLGHETSEAIAIELKANGTPFVTLSGYAQEQHHHAFADAPALNKPLRLQLLLDEIKKCIEQKGNGSISGGGQQPDG
jgi:PAS domain S-box-containing protein